MKDRTEVGHWEGAYIMGAGSHSAIGTLVERRTRYLMLIYVPTDRPTAQSIRDGVCAALQGLAPQLRRQEARAFCDTFYRWSTTITATPGSGCILRSMFTAAGQSRCTKPEQPS